jgi:hypothetical protein
LFDTGFDAISPQCSELALEISMNTLRACLYWMGRELSQAFYNALIFWLLPFSLYCGLFSAMFALFIASEIFETVHAGAPFNVLVVLASIPASIGFAYAARALFRQWLLRYWWRK